MNEPFVKGFCRTQRWAARTGGRVLRAPDWLAYATAVLEESGILAKHYDKVIMAGPHCSAKPEETLELSNGSVDVVCIGEYDYTVKDVVENYSDLKSVKGIAFRDDGKIIETGRKMKHPRHNPTCNVLFHYRPDSLNKFSRMMERYGWINGRLEKRYGAFRLPHFEPIAVFAFLLTPFLILLADKFLAALLYVLNAPHLKKSFLFGRLFRILLYRWNKGFFQGKRE